MFIVSEYFNTATFSIRHNYVRRCMHIDVACFVKYKRQYNLSCSHIKTELYFMIKKIHLKVLLHFYFLFYVFQYTRVLCFDNMVSYNK